MFDVFIFNFHIIGTLFFMVLGWRRVLRGGKSESAIGNWVRPGERPPNAEAMSRKSSTPFSSSTTNSEQQHTTFQILSFLRL